MAGGCSAVPRRLCPAGHRADLDLTELLAPLADRVADRDQLSCTTYDRQRCGADRLLLDAYATQTADRVWALREATLLAAMDAGRDLGQVRQFLTDHTTHELPNPVTTLLTDVGKRSGSLRDLGVVRLVECADPALAALIANDRRLRTYCHLIGDRHLAVTGGRESDFRKAVQALGYFLPPVAPV